MTEEFDQRVVGAGSTLMCRCVGMDYERVSKARALGRVGSTPTIGTRNAVVPEWHRGVLEEHVGLAREGPTPSNRTKVGASPNGYGTSLTRRNSVGSIPAAPTRNSVAWLSWKSATFTSWRSVVRVHPRLPH